jgi:hypothetical protein
MKASGRAKENSSLGRQRAQTREGALGDAKTAPVRRSHRSRRVARSSFASPTSMTAGVTVTWCRDADRNSARTMVGSSRIK